MVRLLLNVYNNSLRQINSTLKRMSDVPRLETELELASDECPRSTLSVWSEGEILKP